MSDQDWNAGTGRTFGVLLAGSEEDDPADGAGEPPSDTLFLAFNAHHERVRFVLPLAAGRWVRLLDTSQRQWGRPHPVRGLTYRVAGRSVAVFRQPANHGTRKDA
jgi:glycogen operon protein